MSPVRKTKIINSVAIKRPENSFMLFARVNRPILAKKHPNLNNADISKLLGPVWFKLSSTQRQYFVDLAKKKKEEHKILYPEYKYRPKHSVKKKEMPLMGYFVNIHFQNIPDSISSVDVDTSDHSTDTEDECDQFDKFEEFCKKIPGDSITHNAPYLDHRDHLNHLEHTFSQEQLDEPHAFPTVYIPYDPFEEFSDSDESLDSLYYDVYRSNCEWSELTLSQLMRQSRV
jgi:hypothetical protein